MFQDQGAATWAYVINEPWVGEQLKKNTAD
jgi:hypothetical protein